MVRSVFTFGLALILLGFSGPSVQEQESNDAAWQESTKFWRKELETMQAYWLKETEALGHPKREYEKRRAERLPEMKEHRRKIVNEFESAFKTLEDPNLDPKIAKKIRGFRELIDEKCLIPPFEESGIPELLADQLKRIELPAAPRGRWRWFTGEDVNHKSDGTITSIDAAGKNTPTTAVWRPVEGKSGTFEFRGLGLQVFTVTANEHGNLLEGRSSSGNPVWAVRLSH